MATIGGFDLSNITGGLTKFQNNAFHGAFKNPNIVSAAGTAMDTIGGFLPDKSVYGGDKGDVAKAADSIYDTASDVIGMVPGWGTVASLAMKGNALLSKGVASLGGGTDGMTTTDAILGSNFFQLTPMGLINGFGGKKSHTLENGQSERDTIASVGSGYGGSVNDWQNAMRYSGKKYGLFSSGARHKANNKVDSANNKMNLMTTISNDAKTQFELANNTADTNNMRYQMQLQGGYNPWTRTGRNGFKIEQINKSRQIANKLRDKETEANIAKHKEGGTFFIPTNWQPSEQLQKFQNGGSVNIIPEGALHARKHHMENADNLTKKGIPVVDNDGNQQAEIERNEIIFRKEVTDRIEQLAKEGTDEAAIECGKLLTHEIIENTDDKTGLALEVIRKHQGGGKVDTSALDDFANGATKQMYQDMLGDFNKQSEKLNEDLNKQSSDAVAQTKILNGLNMFNTAASGIKNAISAGKNQKKLNEQKFAEQKKQMLAGTGDQNGNEQLFNQLQQKQTLPDNTTPMSQQLDNALTQNLEKVPTAQRGIKIPYEKWYATVPSDRNDTKFYDLKLAYENLPIEQLEAWRTATPEELRSGKKHLGSVIELPNGDYEFLKLGAENVNPEVRYETDTYFNGSNGLKNTHDLVYEGDRYYYRKKKK